MGPTMIVYRLRLDFSRKMIKIVATGCHVLKLKCTTFDFGWGSAPDLAGGAYSAPPDPSWILAAYF